MIRVSIGLKRSLIVAALVIFCGIITFQMVQSARNVSNTDVTGGHYPAAMPTSTREPYGPTLYISFREGAPGSKFTFTGFSFPKNEPVSILVNTYPITTLQTTPGMSDWFVFHLDTSQDNEGLYLVTAQTQSVTRSEFFTLDSNEPVREPFTDTVYERACFYGTDWNCIYQPVIHAIYPELTIEGKWEIGDVSWQGCFS